MKRVLSLALTILLSATTTLCAANEFVVVIDPGHGGKDPGTVSKTNQEKSINLNVALRLGTLIKQNHKDVNVVYTRTTDKYVTLQERPNIANAANGDLFISIHTNGVESSQAYGAETFTLGLSKSNANFEVAKRENSVLLLEDGNKETYQGFDPTSPESYIMFEFMQSKYIDQSVEIAYYIQQEFSSIKRLDRGVRQAIFWVLHQVKMPSILVELGFITNPAEEKFLTSADGQEKLAKSIYNAFDKYKHEYDKRTIKNPSTTNSSSSTTTTTTTPTTEPTKTTSETKQQTETSKPSTPAKPEVAEKTETKEPVKVATKEAAKEPVKEPAKETTKNKVVYKIQVFSTKAPLDGKHYEIKRLNHLQPTTYFQENGWYKYVCTESATWAEAKVKLAEAQKIHKDAFIVAFIDGNKIAITDEMKK